MSSYMKQGLRKTILQQDKKTKAHVKSFYKILGEMDEVAKQLDNTLEYTEENINEYVKPIYGRDLDNMEKFIVLGKLNNGKEETTDQPN